ncbi:MAG: hypothetical protein GOVbin3661_82 [Prokaryotic dsDNA virus sp.]|nr:MAG: hypothetical protein GOVbin3661_82 [Prokaryotic dsDNA virus sp.]
MEQQSNTYLKRGKGKSNGNIIKRHFFSYYNKHSKLKKVSRKAYDNFLKELLEAYSNAIVKDNMSLKVGSLGYIRIKATKGKFFNKEGKLAKSLKPNWPATFEYWHKKWPDLTRDEIVALKDKGIKKKVVYFQNEHTNREYYEHYWDTSTTMVKFHRFYEFTPSRQYSRLIAKIVKDPNRKTYYYG